MRDAAPVTEEDLPERIEEVLLPSAVRIPGFDGVLSADDGGEKRKKKKAKLDDGAGVAGVDVDDRKRRGRAASKGSAPARCIAWNRYGTLLAAGCDDGSLVVWDSDTRGAARALRPHSRGSPVRSVAWSRCGRLVASGGSGDNVVALSRVGGRFRSGGASSRHACATAAVLGRSPDLGSAPEQVSFLGVREEETGFFPVASPNSAGGDDANVDSRRLRARVVVSFAEEARKPPLLLTFSVTNAGGESPSPSECKVSAEALPTAPVDGDGASSPAATAVADGSRAGGVVFLGQGRGLVSVLHVASKTFLDAIKLGGGGGGGGGAGTATAATDDGDGDSPAQPRVQSLSLSPCGTLLVATCDDRFVRTIALASVERYDEAAAAAARGAEKTASAADVAAALSRSGSVAPPPSPASTFPASLLRAAGASLLAPDRELFARAGGGAAAGSAPAPTAAASAAASAAAKGPAALRVAWRAGSACACGGGGDEKNPPARFVAAAAASATEHVVCVFDRCTGDLERVLLGPADAGAEAAGVSPAPVAPSSAGKRGAGKGARGKRGAADATAAAGSRLPPDPASAVAWHPRSGSLATLGARSGRAFLWAKAFRENWASFAPGFEELEENEEYVEREDEFDRNPRVGRDGKSSNEPGPGGVRPALAGGAAPDDEGGSGEIELFRDDGGGDEATTRSFAAENESDLEEEDGNVTHCLVRLPFEVWPEREEGESGEEEEEEEEEQRDGRVG